jgi:hypothetical protein
MSDTLNCYIIGIFDHQAVKIPAMIEFNRFGDRILRVPPASPQEIETRNCTVILGATCCQPRTKHLEAIFRRWETGNGGNTKWFERKKMYYNLVSF